MTARLTLDSDPAAFARAATFVSAFAERYRLPTAERDRLLVVIEELITNVVNHGYDGTPPGQIELVLSLDAGALTISLSDDGAPFNPLAHQVGDLAAPVAQRAIGGLGILIWRALVDDARYWRSDGRNRLELTRRLPPPGPPG